MGFQMVRQDPGFDLASRMGTMVAQYSGVGSVLEDEPVPGGG